jgi:hypothetical protein
MIHETWKEMGRPFEPRARMEPVLSVMGRHRRANTRIGRPIGAQR